MTTSATESPQLAGGLVKPSRVEFFAWIFWVAVLLFLCWQRFRFGFELDELEHLHYAWQIGQGKLPFRDFFEHHPPLMHFLIAPLLAHQTALDIQVLLACRIGALVVMIWLSWAHYRILREMVPGYVAAAGLTLPLLICPYSGKLFDLRPDWLALALATWGMLLFYRAVRRTSGSTKIPAFFSGILFGMSAWTSQKAWFLIVIVGCWGLAVALFADGAARRRRWISLGMSAAGFLLPMGGFILFFALRGALDVTLQHMVFLNFAWPAEIDGGWRGWWDETVPYAMGFFAVGFAEAVEVVVDLRKQLREASMTSLLATVLAAGVLAYLKTPVPYEQSLIFFVTIWLGLLAVVWIYRRAERRTFTRRDLVTVAIAGVICGIPLEWPIFVKCIVFWTILGAAAIVMVSLQNDQRPRVLLASALLICICLANHFRAFDRHAAQTDWRNELISAREVEAELKPTDRVLQVDMELPFRNDIDYYWFPAMGIQRQTDQAWARAIDAGTVDVIIGGASIAHLPATSEAMDERFVADRSHNLSQLYHPIPRPPVIRASSTMP